MRIASTRSSFGTLSAIFASRAFNCFFKSSSCRRISSLCRLIFSIRVDSRARSLPTATTFSSSRKQARLRIFTPRAERNAPYCSIERKTTSRGGRGAGSRRQRLPIGGENLFHADDDPPRRPLVRRAVEAEPLARVMLIAVAVLLQGREGDGVHASRFDPRTVDELLDPAAEVRLLPLARPRHRRHRAAVERADDQVHRPSRRALNLDQVDPGGVFRFDQAVVAMAVDQADAVHRPGGGRIGAASRRRRGGEEPSGGNARRHEDRPSRHVPCSVCLAAGFRCSILPGLLQIAESRSVYSSRVAEWN